MLRTKITPLAICAGLAVCASLALCGCTAPEDMTPGETKTFNATLDGDQETPSLDVQGTGSATFTVDTGTRSFSYQVNYTNLTGSVTVAHLHNAPAGTPGPIIVNLSADFAGDDDGMVTGMNTLSASELTELLAGNVYLNLHTSANSDGEIRGQLIETP